MCFKSMYKMHYNEVKLLQNTLFILNIIIYLGNPKEFINKLIGTIR